MRAGRRDEARVRRDRPRPGSSSSSTAPTSPSAGHCAAAATWTPIRAHGAPSGWRPSTTPPATSRPTACGCTCAGATTRDRTTTTSRWRDIIDLVLAARPVGGLVRGRQPPARARVGVFDDRRPARRHSPDPRRDRLHDQLHRASRAGRPAHRPLRRAWSGGNASSPAPTAASPRSRAWPSSTRTSPGPSWPLWPRVPGWPRLSCGARPADPRRQVSVSSTVDLGGQRRCSSAS